jgi:LacI family transcriptional regulator
MSMKSARRRRVAILLEVDDTFSQNMVRAIAEFNESSSRWALLVAPYDQHGRLRLPDGWKGDGVIARLSDREMAEHVRASRLPTVDIDRIIPDHQWAGRVRTDDLKRAQFALEHFLDRGFKRFACFSPFSPRYPLLRAQLFADQAKTAGFSCTVHQAGARTKRRIGWYHREKLIANWLHGLRKPVAIFTPDGFCGRQLVEICEFSGIAIPEEVAIVAGDSDDLMCGALRPSLSAVALSCRRTGHESARMLEQMMNGGSPPPKPVLVEPLGVITRESTDVLAFDDPELADAIGFIRAHATEGINVADVLRALSISRRTLELLFRDHFGRSPAKEIQRVRLARARQLLADTDKTVAEIAETSGFTNATRLGIAFRKQFNMTPLAYRHSLFKNWKSASKMGPE